MSQHQHTEVAAITAMVRARRPDWNERGIRSVIEQMLTEHPAEDVTRAALRGADTPAARTPSFMALPGKHWVEEPKGTTVGGPALGPLPECEACGQPAKRDAQPRICPACGAHWKARDWGDDLPGTAAGAVSQTCPACQHRQAGRFAFCGKCGASIPDVPAAVRPVAAVVPEREHLDDPMPLGLAIGQWRDALPFEASERLVEGPPPF